MSALAVENQQIHVRHARQDDMEWVNKSYDAVNFVHSDFANEIIAIAQVGNERVGVGRLVFIQENVYELGGMYVGEQYRGHKIASKIITFLLENAKQEWTIYCLPFKHLEDFYKRFGLKPRTALDELPKKVADKLKWCNETYEYAVSCLIRRRQDLK